jgi:hypothetical protein
MASFSIDEIRDRTGEMKRYWQKSDPGFPILINIPRVGPSTFSSEINL